MRNPYTPLGNGRIYRDDRNGAVVVDADSIGRSGFAGEDFGNDGQEQPQYGGSEGGDPSYDGDPDNEGFGANRNPRGQYPNRQPTQSRQPYPQSRPQQSRIVDSNKDGIPDGWISTFLTGSTTIDAAGQATVTIRSQHPFLATDVTFEGSAAGAKITQIMFGARPVVNATDGIPTSVFTPTSQMRKHLEGQSLKGGLDIVVTGTLTGAGTLCAVFFGYKPPEG